MNLGRIAIVPQGVYNPDRVYKKLDGVSHEGSFYIALQYVPKGSIPGLDSVRWMLSAKKGDKGDTTWEGIEGKPDTFAPASHEHTDYLTIDTEQNITSGKDFKAGLKINGAKYYSDTTKNLLVSGINTFNNNYTNIKDVAVGIGTNIFPAFNVQPYKGDGQGEDYNNKGYVGIGGYIFPQYTGNTNYRPDHNAHDSWVGIGRHLGGGFEDGTNITLMGTTNLHKNDVKYADSVTVVGKGNTNGIGTTYPTPLDPNRVVTSKGGINMRGMMTDVTIVGHENWCGDISKSVIVGSNTRLYSYIFNSTVLGIDNANWNLEGDAEQKKMYLDSDVIIGTANYKRFPRHEQSHNLLIGVGPTYSTAGTLNEEYRSLIEGVMKTGKEKLQVNGTIIGGHAKIGEDSPLLDKIMIDPTGLPAGVTLNAATNELTFTGASSNHAITLKTLPADVNSQYYIKILNTAPITAGKWGYQVIGLVDSDNGDGWVMERAIKAETASPYIFTTEGAFVGKMKFEITKISLGSDHTIKSNLSFKDSLENITFESRSGTLDNKHSIFGKNSGQFLYKGKNSLIFGNNNYANTIFGDKSTMFGHDIGEFNLDSRRDVLVGNNIVKTAKAGTGSNVMVGTDIMTIPTIARISSNVIVGTGTLKNFTSGDKNVVLGADASFPLKVGNGNTIIGNSSGMFKEGSGNVFIGNTAGGYNLMESTLNNVIVIGAGTTPRGGDNTVTIGNASITDNFFYGNMHASAFLETSLREFKKNIQAFDKSGLELIKELDIVTFDRNDSEIKNKIGIIADDSPKEFLSEERDSVDLYKTTFIQAKAIQELNEENIKLRRDLEELKQLVMEKLK